MYIHLRWLSCDGWKSLLKYPIIIITYRERIQNSALRFDMACNTCSSTGHADVNITYALFCFPVSFLHSLSANCGAGAGTIVQTYSTPNIDISGKTWVWGSFPFPRASKLEMSCSGTLVKLLLIWHKLAKLATFCFWSISHFWTLRLSTYSHWESTWDEDAQQFPGCFSHLQVSIALKQRIRIKCTQT